jgi:hypothetical protein
MICSDEKRNNLNKYTMTEKTKQLIETGKTIERLYENGKIEIGAYTILIDRNKQAINYSRCCEGLKVEEKLTFSKWLEANKYEYRHNNLYRQEGNKLLTHVDLLGKEYIKYFNL